MISDVSVGYGTPQVLSMTDSLCRWADADGLILEPDEPERPPIAIPNLKDTQIRRLYTTNHPYTLSGRYEFCMQAAEIIDREKPDILILSAFVGAGAILRMKHKPLLTIYYGIEHSDGTMWRELELMPLIADKIDIAIFCEETRAQLDAPRLGLDDKPKLVLYNGSSTNVKPLPATERNGRFFYGGLVHPELTYGDRYLDGSLDKFPIDIYGLVNGYENKTEKLSSLIQRNSRVSYNGYIKGGAQFLEILRQYQFSIVMWAPVRESFRYAAPNKFFDAIQAGVPVITAPHPMCKTLVERYKCGVVMEDWSEDAMIKALSDARKLSLSNRYEEMVEENLPIARQKLSWDQQFLKLARLLEGWDERKKADAEKAGKKSKGRSKRGRKPSIGA